MSFSLCSQFNISIPRFRCCSGSESAEPPDPSPTEIELAQLKEQIKAMKEEREEEERKQQEVHTKLAPPGSFIAVYPYPDGSIKTLVPGKDVCTSDITGYNKERDYVVSSGPNLKVFGKEHDKILGTNFIEQDWLPGSITSFVNNMIDYTFDGLYINVITSWEGQHWHFHTHPIYNKKIDGEVIGCIFVTEKYSRPLIMNTTLASLAKETPNESIEYNPNSEDGGLPDSHPEIFK